MSNELSRKKEMNTIEHKLTPFEESLTNDMDLSRAIIRDQKIKNTSVHRSSFDSSLVRTCDFDDVDASRCDIEGSQFEYVNFRNTKFAHADMRSSTFANCTFINCSFADAFIDDVTFSACQIMDCDFSDSAFTKSSITDCQINRTVFSRSTNQLNTYRAVRFHDVVLGDCTFGLHVVTNCVFANVVVNADAFGFLYGLQQSDLLNMSYVIKGKRVIVNSGDALIPLLEAEYEKRHWTIQKAVLRLNCRNSSVVYILSNLFKELLEDIHAGVLAKRDEIQFLQMILDELHEEDRLPFFSVADAIERLSLIAPQELNSMSRLFAELASVRNNLLFRLEEGFEILSRISAPFEDFSVDRPVVVEMRFKKEPDLRLVEFLDELDGVFMNGSKKKPRLLDRRNGSIIYVLEMSVKCALYISILLFFLEGAIIQLTRIRARSKILFKPHLPRPYSIEALKPKLSVPAHLLPVLKGLSRFLGNRMDLWKSGLQGLDKENIESIDISDTETH